MEDEIDIIQKAAHGDAKAWSYLHSTYEKPLLSFIKYHGSSLDTMEPEDILQETWESIIQKEKLHSYDPEKSSLYKYLLSITKYEILHYYDRKNKKFRIHGQDHRLILINEADIHDEKQQNNSVSMEEQLSIMVYNRLVEQNIINCNDLYALLEIFPHGGPPHQILAFGFNRLLSHWRKKPKKISNELSTELLHILTQLFIDDFLKEIHTQFPGEPLDSFHDLTIKEYFTPLELCMEKMVAEVLSERDSKDHYHIDLKKKTGETVLHEYYTGKPEKHISDWTDKVMKRLKKLWQENKEKIDRG